MDKSWLLNPKAIQAAKACIQQVDQELGVKLKLSHPDFLDLLYDYCELTDSEQLSRAFKLLVGMAGAEVKSELIKSHAQAKVTPIHTHQQKSAPIKANQDIDFIEQPLPVAYDELIQYQGRNYPRWQDNKEFKGLYRGQPRYV